MKKDTKKNYRPSIINRPKKTATLIICDDQALSPSEEKAVKKFFSCLGHEVHVLHKRPDRSISIEVDFLNRR